MDHLSNDDLLYGPLTARIRRMLEPGAHDSFLFYKDTVRLLEPEMKSDGKVLDAGCGRGTITAWIAEQNHKVVAIDSSALHIEQTRTLLQERHLINNVSLEVSKLPDAFPEDHFDVILDCFSWWHISDWGRLLNLCRKNVKAVGRIIILDTFLGWKTSLEFRQEMRELWHTALPTLNECRNMLIKREFRLLKVDSIQESYINYLDAISSKILELEKEDLGTLEPMELKDVKKMWQWFQEASHKEELVATQIVAELTES